MITSIAGGARKPAAGVLKSAAKWLNKESGFTRGGESATYAQRSLRPAKLHNCHSVENLALP